jgi:methyl-accepting chemotaxis protein
MARTRSGVFPLVIPALVILPLAGVVCVFLAVHWFGADSDAALKRRIVDAAATAGKQLEASVQRQSAATQALGTSPMVWLWVKFQGERLSPSNRSHAQWALDEVSNYAGLLPGVTVYMASERTRTVYQGGAAVAALSGGPTDSWYASSLAAEGVLVSDDPHALRTSMRLMNGQTLLGAVSCVGDVTSLAEGAFSPAEEEPAFSFALADRDGSVVLARGEAAAGAPTVFDMYNTAERGSVRAMMDDVVRPGAMSVGVFGAKGRRVITAVTRTTAPGWYLFVSSDLPGVPVGRLFITAGIPAAALLLLVAALVFLGITQSKKVELLVQWLERERSTAAGIARDVGAAAMRLRAAAGTIRDRAGALASEAASGKAAGSEALGALGSSEELSAELRTGIAGRVSLLDELASRAREAVAKSRNARAAVDAVGVGAAAAEEDLNRVISTGSAVSLSVENAVKGVEAVVEAAERTRLLALNAALDTTRSGGQVRGGARVADEMRRLAEEGAEHAQALSAALDEARSGIRAVSRAAQEAGKTVHQAAGHSADTAQGLDAASQGVEEIISRLEGAHVSAARLREDVVSGDRGRSAVEGLGKIMARVEALCAEIAVLADAVASESTQAAQRASDAGVPAPRSEPFS